MANQEHIDILRQGVEVWNTWRRDNETITPDLSNADFSKEQLEGTNFGKAKLEEADFSYAHLEEADFSYAHLEEADFFHALGKRARFSYAHLEKANFSYTHLEKARFHSAQLEGANFAGAQLEGANFKRAQLEGADFTGAQLEGANFSHAQLKGADFTKAQLERVDLRGAKIESVNLPGTRLIDEQGIGPCVVDASWSGTNLSVIDYWSEIIQLGDEMLARKETEDDGKKKKSETRLREYKDAMRATNQLSVVLQEQGLTRDASHFAYRGKCLERTVYWYQMQTVRWHDQKSGNRTRQSIRRGLTQFISLSSSWLFSWFLFLIAGYGYRLRFCLFWYLLCILGFATAYFLLEHSLFTWWTALGESVNIFHGRGASPNPPQLTHPARFAILTIMEAWSGLVIEVVFVATLLQRFFGK